MTAAPIRTKQQFEKGDSRLLFICEKASELSSPKLEKAIEKLILRCTRFCEQSLLEKCSGGGYYVYKLKIHVRKEQKRTVLSVCATFSDRTARQTLQRSDNTYCFKLI